MTHCRLLLENPRSCWMDGSATFVIVASRTTMNWAKQTRTRTSQRLAGGRSARTGVRRRAVVVMAASGREGVRAAVEPDWPIRLSNVADRTRGSHFCAANHDAGAIDAAGDREPPTRK